ncbi:Eukaryotic translation initiation factor [Salix suchowensis]|nr:Eukaryotic translation initiation factor [Salix suchowensis]
MSTDGKHIELNQYFQSPNRLFSEKEIKMAASPIYLKTSFHARSNSLPSRPHPIVSEFDEHICRVRDSEGTSTSSSSSIGHKLSGLQDLYDSVDKFLQLPLTQQSLAREQNQKYFTKNLNFNDRTVNTSATLREIFLHSKDALLQSKEYIRELQSVIRRRQGGVDGEIRKYMASRKVVKKSIKKALKNMKSAGNKCTFSNEDPEITMLREVESISLALFESLLSFISEPKPQAKKSGWSLVSKLINHHGIACEEEETNVNEFAMADSALQSLISCKTDTMMGVQKKLSNLELCIEDLEDGIDGLFRRMIKNRASFLNIFS